MLDAVADARARGVPVLIVTGRILSELVAEFPDVTRHCDAIVAENGAIVAGVDNARSLAPPVEQELVERLRARGVPCRQGEVIVAAKVEHRDAITQALQVLGLDHQVIANRSELMVVPAGVTKATGAVAALAEFGISSHSALAVGDAENDHALLMVCEVGVAVANAFEALTAPVCLMGTSGSTGRPAARLRHGRLGAGTTGTGHPCERLRSPSAGQRERRARRPVRRDREERRFEQCPDALGGEAGTAIEPVVQAPDRPADGRGVMAGEFDEMLDGLARAAIGEQAVAEGPAGDHVNLISHASSVFPYQRSSQSRRSRPGSDPRSPGPSWLASVSPTSLT